MVPRDILRRLLISGCSQVIAAFGAALNSLQRPASGRKQVRNEQDQSSLERVKTVGPVAAVSERMPPNIPL